ncbi:hypothetical protein I4F81_004691 [Pyropia yezoensis]|uniref:Uncharacterized protein n=1 Tax=Pyropia yezoensis TaxID=2788 RepID=A0ACC3BWK4_PYRYE|nr:hypothetical protein I4F81_004691 [Neopyropia yezoensis]
MPSRARAPTRTSPRQPSGNDLDGLMAAAQIAAALVDPRAVGLPLAAGVPAGAPPPPPPPPRRCPPPRSAGGTHPSFGRPRCPPSTACCWARRRAECPASHEWAGGDLPRRGSATGPPRPTPAEDQRFQVAGAAAHPRRRTDGADPGGICHPPDSAVHRPLLLSPRGPATCGGRVSRGLSAAVRSV